MTHCKTTQIKKAFSNYFNSNYYRLSDLYSSYSINKERAFGYCMDLFLKYNGYDLKIIGGNCMTFSVGFLGEYPDPVTGELKKAFFYITKNYDRYIFIDEI